MDLGECPKIHDLALRADYAKASKEKDYFYDIDVSTTAVREPNDDFRVKNSERERRRRVPSRIPADDFARSIVIVKKL